MSGMTGAYQMIFINGIASILMLFSLLVYRYIYPQKKLPLFMVLLTLSFLPLISLLRIGTYESGDLSIHATRAMFFYDSLFVDHIYPRWSHYFNFGYGSPHFNFAYFLPYFLISIIHSVGFSFITSVKILLAVFFIGSGLIMYIWIKDELGERSAFVAGVFYLFAPYHLVDLHFRVTIAEIMSFALVPLNLFCIRKVMTTNHSHRLLASAISLALLILSHQAITLIALPFFGLYALSLLYRRRKLDLLPLVRVILSWIFGFLLSAFFWLPILFEAQYILQSINGNLWFPHITEFLFSPWRYGFLFQGPNGELSYLLGYINLIVIGIFILLLLKKKIKDKYFAVFLLSSFFLLFFLMQEISRPIWEFLPLMKNFQFSYRILVLLTLVMAAIAGYTVKVIQNKYFLMGICILAIGTTILNWGNRRVIPEIDDQYLYYESQTSPTNVPGLDEVTAPKWIELDKTPYKVRPKNTLEVLTGDARIHTISNNAHAHEYVIYVQRDTKFRHNTLYFPGWQVITNNRAQKISYDNNELPGIITFDLQKGLYKVDVLFTDTPVRILGNIISSISVSIVLLYFLFHLKKKIFHYYFAFHNRS